MKTKQQLQMLNGSYNMVFATFYLSPICKLKRQKTSLFIDQSQMKSKNNSTINKRVHLLFMVRFQNPKQTDYHDSGSLVDSSNVLSSNNT